MHCADGRCALPTIDFPRNNSKQQATAAETLRKASPLNSFGLLALG